jgi:DMSO reductase anchor subunit
MLFTWLPQGATALLAQATGWGAAVSGVAALYFMHRIYRIPARPFWNHWQVLTAFYGNMLALGPLLIVLALAAVATAQGLPWAATAGTLAAVMLAGLALEAVGLYCHVRDLRREGGEGEASHHEQRTTFGNTYWLRNVGLGLSMGLLALIAVLQPDGLPGLLLWTGAASTVFATALIGRALFYALVIPTTMPGAFFWRNKGFEQHARETGLARLPQVGVLPECH